MRKERTDYVVIGFSLAGVAAALLLAKSGNRVVLLDYDRDTDDIAGLPRVQMTSLAPAMSGAAFEEMMNGVFVLSGIARESHCHVLSVRGGESTTVECSDRQWACKGVVFAPNGTEPGLELKGSSTLHGFGVSYSVLADMPYFLSQRVAVYGDNYRAVEQGWIAAQYASKVLLLIKESTVEGDPVLLEELRSMISVEFDHPALVRALRATNDGMLASVESESPKGCRWTDVSALFVAQHLVPITDVLRDDGSISRIAFAGLVSGVDYWRHAALVDDGVRAARTLLAF